MLVAFLGLALIIPNLVALIGWVLALTGIQGSAFPEPPTTPRRATRGFLADAAHELRTPIAGIQAAAEQVAASAQQRDDPESRRQQRRADLLQGESRRAGRLVTDMLDLSRIDAGLPLHAMDAISQRSPTPRCSTRPRSRGSPPRRPPVDGSTRSQDSDDAPLKTDRIHV